MNKKNQSKYTREQRLLIIKEYETGGLSAEKVGRKYGISGITLTSWRTRLQESSKKCTFAAESDTNVADEEPMKEKSKAELEAELAQVKKELEWAKLQNLALNTMIDIAEEQGIQIRKKSGAKQ